MLPDEALDIIYYYHHNLKFSLVLKEMVRYLDKLWADRFYHPVISHNYMKNMNSLLMINDLSVL
jgi:hypothetical protein